MKKQVNMKNKIESVLVLSSLIIIWQLSSSFGLVPRFLLPSPIDVISALVNDFPLILSHVGVTLTEAFLGLFFGVSLGFLIAFTMTMSPFMYRALYPIIVITQTVPTIAIAPLLVLWLGYSILPKVVLIVLVTFFPIAVGLYDGFNSIDKDSVLLLKSMGASDFKIFKMVRIKGSLDYFFAALKVSSSYSIVGAVISEWIGGFNGLGVYMIRVKKSYSYDKMFAVIFIISLLSLLLMGIVKYLRFKAMPWERRRI